MKKRLLTILVLTLVFCFALTASAYAETKTISLVIGDPYMTVNGVKQEIDPGRGTKPVVIQGRTMVPIRTIVENMGGSISWDAIQRQVIMTANNKTVRVALDYNKADVKSLTPGEDWTQKTLDVAPLAINGRTMVPLRFVTEELGATVNWDAKTQTVTLTFAVAGFNPLNWTGQWETNEGPLVLNQSGSNVVQVSGEYPGYNIIATVSGKTLTGQWFNVDGQLEGDIILTISDDGKIFTGKYCYNTPLNPLEIDPEDPDYGWYEMKGYRK